MNPKRLHDAAEDAKIYAAAHSMDSGWFAVDDEGIVAHFDTGEGGAMPNSAKLVTGEASAMADDGWEFVLPWLARQRGKSTKGLDLAAPFSVAFETEAEAKAATARFAEGRQDLKTRIVEFFPDDLDGALHASVSALPGFIGFGPTYDETYEDDTLSERYPIVFYAHGRWEIPGEYVRRSGTMMDTPTGEAASDPELLERAEHMATSFADQETIQLADFYDNADCQSWGEGDLRTGDVPERNKKTPTAQKTQSAGSEPWSTPKVVMVLVVALAVLWFVLRLFLQQ